jgi:hypothetical protein
LLFSSATCHCFLACAFARGGKLILRSVQRCVHLCEFGIEQPNSLFGRCQSLSLFLHYGWLFLADCSNARVGFFLQAARQALDQILQCVREGSFAAGGAPSSSLSSRRYLWIVVFVEERWRVRLWRFSQAS